MSSNQMGEYICMIILNTFFFRIRWKSLAKHLERFVCSRQKVGKKDKLLNISNIVYWQGNVLSNRRPKNAQYGYPDSVLSFIPKIPQISHKNLEFPRRRSGPWEIHWTNQNFIRKQRELTKLRLKTHCQVWDNFWQLKVL